MEERVREGVSDITDILRVGGERLRVSSCSTANCSRQTPSELNIVGILLLTLSLQSDVERR